jgi:hypothetical protein
LAKGQTVSIDRGLPPRSVIVVAAMSLAASLAQRASAAEACFAREASEKIEVFVSEQLASFEQHCKVRADLGYKESEMQTPFLDVGGLYRDGVYGTKCSAIDAVTSCFQTKLASMGFEEHIVQWICNIWYLKVSWKGVGDSGPDASASLSRREVGLSINLNALTLEQVVAKRHEVIGVMCDNLQIEVLQAVSMWVDALPGVSRWMTADTAKLKGQVENTFSEIKNRQPESFNIDLQFSSAITDAFAVQASVFPDLSLLKDFLEDGDELKKWLSDHKYANITEIMIHCIRNKDNSVPVRIAAIKTLGEVSETYDEASINALGGCLLEKIVDVNIKRSAGEVLHKLMPATTTRNKIGDAWAAITKAGEVVSWGDAATGGDSSMAQQQLRGVKSIAAGDRAFAALKEWVPS